MNILPGRSAVDPRRVAVGWAQSARSAAPWWRGGPDRVTWPDKAGNSEPAQGSAATVLDKFEEAGADAGHLMAIVLLGDGPESWVFLRTALYRIPAALPESAALIDGGGVRSIRLAAQEVDGGPVPLRLPPWHDVAEGFRIRMLRSGQNLPR